MDSLGFMQHIEVLPAVLMNCKPIYATDKNRYMGAIFLLSKPRFKWLQPDSVSECRKHYFG